MLRKRDERCSYPVFPHPGVGIATRGHTINRGHEGSIYWIFGPKEKYAVHYAGLRCLNVLQMACEVI